MKKKMHVKKGDQVKVISGNEKGKEGKVLEVDLNQSRVKVEAINLRYFHEKPSQKHPKGKRERKEAFLHSSNVMLLVDGQSTRTGVKIVDGKRKRFAKKTGNIVE